MCLSILRHKIRFMLITTRQKRQNLTLKCPSISFGDQTVNEVDNNDSSGVTTGCSLSWKSTSKTENVPVIKHFVGLHARKVFFHAQVQPSSTTDRRCGTQQVQILSNLGLVYIRQCSRQLHKTEAGSSAGQL